MKIKLLVCLAGLMLCSVIGGFRADAETIQVRQEDQSSPDKDQFLRVDKSRILTGILYGLATPLSKMESFNGSPSTTTLTLSAWEQIYFEIYNSYVSSPSIWTVDLIEKQAQIFEENHQVPLAVLNMHYNKIKDYAIQNNLLQVTDGRLYDGDNREESPYWDQQVFAAAVVSNKILSAETVFALDPAFYFSNETRPVQSIEVDFSDGSGLRSAHWGDRFNIRYSSGGIKTARLIFSMDSQKVESIFSFEVQSAGVSGAFHAAAAAAIDPYAKWMNVKSNYPYQNDYAVFDAKVILGSGHSKLVRPVILVEGFDPDNSVGFDQMYAIANQPNSRGQKMVDLLLGQGYDLVLFNYHNGTDYIQRNALGLETFIEAVNAETGGEPIVLMGASMGGLVCKYALMHMESTRRNHNVKLYISFDSPQKGANIPLGVQHFVDFFASDSADAEKGRNVLNSPAAKQMLLYHYSAGNATNDSLKTSLDSEFNQWGNFPKSARRVALSDGSGLGHLQQGNGERLLTPSDEIIHYMHHELAVGITGNTYALPDHGERMIFDGELRKWGWLGPLNETKKTRKVYVSGNYPLDGMAGGYAGTASVIAKDYGNAVNVGIGYIFGNFTLLKVSQGSASSDFPVHCFIPTVSALGLDVSSATLSKDQINERSPFDKIYIDEDANADHIKVTPKIADFILDQIHLSEKGLVLEKRKFDYNSHYLASMSTITLAAQFPFTVESYASVVSKSPRLIQLEPGFTAKAGSQFTATIDNSLRPSPSNSLTSQRPDSYVKGEILIRIKSGVLISALSDFNQRLDITGATLISDRIYTLTFAQNTDVLWIVDQYKNNPNVEAAQPNYIYKISGAPLLSSSSDEKVLVKAPPTDFSEFIVYPNPFKPGPSDGASGKVYQAGDAESGIIFDRVPDTAQIEIYNLSGRLVRSLSPQTGSGRAQWDVKNSEGELVASGIYFYQVKAAGQKIDGKVAIVR